MVDVLESLAGVVQGCAVSTVHQVPTSTGTRQWPGVHHFTIHQVFGWLRPTLASLVHLVDLYHNYSTIVELVRSAT